MRGIQTSTCKLVKERKSQWVRQMHVSGNENANEREGVRGGKRMSEIYKVGLVSGLAPAPWAFGDGC